MDREEHREAVDAWVAEEERAAVFSADQRRDVSSALYSLCELGLIEGLDSLEFEQALRIWAAVEKARRDGFPDALAM